MKKLIAVVIAVMAVGLGVAFAAPGDKGTVFVPLAGTIGSTGAASKAAGELRYNASYVYLNVSTAARPKWRRISVGGGF